MKPYKILYAASTSSHLRRFHTPYIEELRKTAEVYTMATGEDADIQIPFDKHFFSFTNLKNIFRIRRAIKRERFDLLILNTALAAFLVRLSLFGIRQRPYVLNIVHGYLFPKQGKGLKNKILFLCEKMTRRYTDEIAVMNREDLEIAQKYKLARGKISFCRSMGVPEFSHAARDEELRRAFADDGEILCTFVGELSGRKNQVFLLKAIKALREKGAAVRLLLLGEGAARPELEKEIEELQLSKIVTLAGNREPVSPYLAITDIYLSASESEGLPFNIMEAMYAGLPILASDVKGQNDLLGNIPGSLYPLNDMDAFLHAFLGILQKISEEKSKIEYPNIQNYMLPTVFDETLQIMKDCIKTDE